MKRKLPYCQEVTDKASVQGAGIYGAELHDNANRWQLIENFHTFPVLILMQSHLTSL